MDPRFYFAHWVLGTTLQLKGQLSEAVAEYGKAVELNDDPSVLALLGQAYARAGQRDEAQKIMLRLHEAAKSRCPRLQLCVNVSGPGRQRAGD
jgi:tetratricopeptide (TPR) repeat protein